MRHFTRGRSPFRVRLACVRHAASVQSEPESNSPVQIFCSRIKRQLEISKLLTKTISWLHQFFPTRYSLVKEPPGAAAPAAHPARCGTLSYPPPDVNNFFQTRNLFSRRPCRPPSPSARWGICPISTPPSTTFFQFGIFFAALPCPAVLPQREISLCTTAPPLSTAFGTIIRVKLSDSVI